MKRIWGFPVTFLMVHILRSLELVEAALMHTSFLLRPLGDHQDPQMGLGSAPCCCLGLGSRSRKSLGTGPFLGSRGVVTWTPWHLESRLSLHTFESRGESLSPVHVQVDGSQGRPKQTPHTASRLAGGPGRNWLST